MRKNVDGQVVKMWAWDTFVGAHKVGDKSNITAYVSLDAGVPVALGNPEELDAVKHKGCYYYTLTAAQTNGDTVSVQAASATANIIIGIVVKDTVA